MLSAYLIGIIVYWAEMLDKPSIDRPKLLHYLFPRDVWGHPSAVEDYVLCLANGVILLIVFKLKALYQYFGHMMNDVEQYLFSAPNRNVAEAPGVDIVVLFAIASFLMRDLFYYISHRLSHRIPALWEFHKIHHSAQVLTPFTSYRMHPIDYVLNIGISALGTGLAAVIFIHFYPGLTRNMIVPGITFCYIMIYILGANLRHSHIWLSFGPFVEHIFFSPAQHQIHHSTDPRHFNKNFASDLSIWDWMFGSLYVTHGKENIRVGLVESDGRNSYKSVWDMYVQPFHHIFFSRKKAPLN